MTTATIDDYVAGDSAMYEFHVRDENGPLDLTGALTAKWSIAAGKLSPVGAPSLIGDKIYQRTLGAGVSIIDAVGGKLRVSVGHGDFTGVGNFVHELEVTLASGDSYTAAQGVFRSRPAVHAEA